MKPRTVLSVVVSAVLTLGAFLLSGGRRHTTETVQLPANNVKLTRGEQIVEISARGGYHPVRSVAKAGIPTVLRFKTHGSFDCSSFIRIPALDLAQPLQQTGTTDVAVGLQPVRTLHGMCTMGMYHFQVEFK
jgi:plastocyanin domain-containing protein